MIALLIALASSSLTCENLHKDLAAHEKLWSIMHNLQSKLVQSSQQIDTGYQYEMKRKKLENDDAKFALQADRIVTLIVANKCTPPDHVASWTTYPPDAK